MTDIREQLQATLQGAYSIERELGGGGMSRVFVATETALGRRVVIKVLPPELAGGVNVERFRREIAVVAQLQHPHIVPVLTAGEMSDVDGTRLPYFTMPYVEGQSLRARLAGGELPLGDVLWILRDVAKALGYAHKHGVVHRDMKPDNVLLNEDAAVVTDFGVAKALTAASARDGQSNMTSLGVALGTPAYMSPEQAAAAPNVDHRADIYAMGIVAYEMIAGRTPFAGRSPQQMLAAHSVEAPTPIDTVRTTVSPALAALVMRCLEKSPADRPQSVDAVLHELNAIATPSGGTAPHVTASAAAASASGARVPRWVRATAAGLVLVMAGGVVWAARRPATAVDAQVIAVFPFRVTSSDASLEYLREAMADLLSMKLAGDSGLRASDLRAVMAAWNRAGGGDLSAEQLSGIARELGAGQLITGEVVGTGGRLVINASLTPVGAGNPIRRTVQGHADSISALVDVLTAQLLSLRAGEDEARLSALTRTPLVALRAYLEGQSAYRRGHYQQARQAYRRALLEDPDFLQAIVGLSRADSWGGNVARRDSLRGVAWRRRDELSAVDRLLMAAEAGERAPGYTPFAMRIAAAERATQVAWDNVEAWALLADEYFHAGPMMGNPEAMRRALAAFNRALRIDSTFRPAVDHLYQLYHVLGDTAGRRRAAEHLWRMDSGSGRATAARWFDAMARGDSAMLRQIERNEDAIGGMLITASNTGIGIPTIDSGFARFDRESVLPADRRGLAGFRRSFDANTGRPAMLSADLSLVAENPTAVDQRPLYALFWDADSSDGARGAAAIRDRWTTPVVSRQLSRRATELTGLALWLLDRGEERGLRDVQTQLRQIAAMPDTIPGQAVAPVALLMIDAIVADRDRRPNADAALARLDSAALLVSGSILVTSVANLVIARLAERQANLSLALAATRRREYFNLVSPYFLSTYLREEGRFAEATGDREGAIRAYEHYLKLRYKPEPAWQADADRVARTVERLKRESAGK